MKRNTTREKEKRELQNSKKTLTKWQQSALTNNYINVNRLNSPIKRYSGWMD